MAWLAPMTAVANNPFHAFEFNTYVRDNLLHLKALADSTETASNNTRNWTRTGTVSVSFSSAESHTRTVNYGFTFPGEPKVFVNIRDAGASAARWDARADTYSTTSFRLFVYSNAAGAPSTWSSVPVDWLAVYRP